MTGNGAQKGGKMAKNRIRGKPKKRTNRARDSDITKKIEKDVDKLIDKSIRILYNMHKILSGRGARIFFDNIYTLAYI